MSPPSRSRTKTKTSSRLLSGVLPFEPSRIPAELIAGLTLAALGVPEVLGYAKIAGMPVVTGLFTLVLPSMVFVLFCSSRHLVIGADSATAAILASSLAGSAPLASPRYVALAGTAALVTGACLLAVRVVRLGFVANFLSRTVLVGFLTGVGISVAISQLGEMLGMPSDSRSTLRQVLELARGLSGIHTPTALTSLAVMLVVAGTRKLTRRLPGALVAVIAAILVSWWADLGQHQIALVGSVPNGLPSLRLPQLSLPDLQLVLKPALAMVVVILAQSSATSRSYAAKYGETVDENLDLVGLAVANVAASLSGTFVVNGSPTKTQMVDGAGGRSQLAQLSTALVVVLVLLFFTAPLAHLPLAALSTIVFLIGLQLIDLQGMKKILSVRRHEFVVALLTTAAVVVVGVEQGVILAVLASIIDHLRHSYAPHNSVLVRGADQHWHAVAPDPRAQSAPGLLIFRFGSSLYYANAHNLYEQVLTLLDAQEQVTCVCLDLVAVGDIDYSAAATLQRLQQQLSERDVRLVFAQIPAKVQSQLDKYGISKLVGAEACCETLEDAVKLAAATAS